MPRFTMPFDGASFIQICEDFDIDPTPTFPKTIDGKGVENRYVKFFDDKSGAGGATRQFVLFSPDLTTRIIAGPLTLLKHKGVACGFSIEDALLYDKVYVVGFKTDPNIAQSDVAKKIASLGIEIDENVPINSPTDLREYLESEL